MKYKVDKYTDKIFIRFNGGGDTYGAITKLPHYKIWTKLLAQLKKRGFEIKTPKYYIERKSRQNLNKVAYKNNVVFCLELMGNQIKIEYGDIKNLWKDWEYNFWTLTDNRATQLTYFYH